MTDIIENLVHLLDEFIENTEITSSTLITEDGLIIAANDTQNFEDESNSMDIGAIAASVLAMAERGISIFNAAKRLEQIKIDGGLNHNIDEDFSIMISRIYSNILLQVIIPKKISIGLIHFEINKISNKIKNLINENTKRELFSRIGSLT